MKKEYTNLDELRDFVNTHNLMNRVSIIQFNAIVSITTISSKIVNKNIPIMITYDGFDSYGKVTLLESDIDPLLYPTIFEGKWNVFEHVDNERLLVRGNHTRNSDIGEYRVAIIPLDKLRD